MKRFAAFASVVLVMIAAIAWAQQAPVAGRGMGRIGQQLYDPSKAETISGEVAAVKEFTSRNGMRKGIGMTIKAAGQQTLVHLGPAFYLENQSVKITAGDQVEVIGVKTIRRGQEVFLAGEVKKGGEVLKLRDENGQPLWAGAGPVSVKKQRKVPVGC